MLIWRINPLLVWSSHLSRLY